MWAWVFCAVSGRGNMYQQTSKVNDSAQYKMHTGYEYFIQPASESESKSEEVGTPS